MTRPVKFFAAEVQRVTMDQAAKLKLKRCQREYRVRVRDRGHSHDPVLDGEDDEGVRRERLADELGDVDDRAEPAVLGANESGLGLEVEDGGVRDRGLVHLDRVSGGDLALFQSECGLTCWMK
jgi:hypothetical protein